MHPTTPQSAGAMHQRPTPYLHARPSSPYPPAHQSAASAYRPATPNARGQYSASTLSSLEAQPAELDAMASKIHQLKELSIAIGGEIRESSRVVEGLEEGFESARRQLGGTMRRMLRMAERTGVGWRAWVGFFAVLAGLFFWVWVF
ncbi:MAG: protein transport protein bet1 [Trizodia sp. TS-e1964]|nr:MAG: protein transport protein bet1 [Trizodia sp. TS-e1964]